MKKLISDQRIFMNTLVEFIAWSDLDRDKIHETFDLGFQQFHFVIERFSRFNKESELYRLNLSGNKKVNVSEELFNLLKYSIEIAEKTNGAYDPTIIDILEAYGYDAQYKFEKLHNKAILKKEIQNILKIRSSYKEIQLYPRSCSVKLARGQRLDFGSIGKGYAVDKAYKKLNPLSNFLINAGGDIKAMGEYKDKKPWLVGLKVPKLGTIGRIRLQNESICCSGSWARKVKFFHHLVSPLNGKPQNRFQTIFVKAKNAINADAWATALFVYKKDIYELIRKNNLKALLVYKNNKIKNIGIKLINSR